MISEDDLYSIGRKYNEKRAAGLGPVGWGALGGAGFGLLNHWLRPKDRDDHGIGSALLSMLTGAGIGAAGGLAYKSLGSNPFAPGPSQTADKPAGGSVLSKEDEDAVRASLVEQFGKDPVSENKGPEIAVQNVDGTTVGNTEDAAAAAAAVKQQDGAGNGAVEIPGATGAAAPVQQTTLQNETQQTQVQNANKDIKPVAQKKSFFVPSAENMASYENIAKNNPDATITGEELVAEVLKAKATYPGGVPIVRNPADPNSGSVFVENVPFQMTPEIAFRTPTNINGIVDPGANFSGQVVKQITPAAENGWWCVAGSDGSVYPLVRTPYGIVPAVNDPVYDATKTTFDRASGSAREWGGNALGWLLENARDGVRGTVSDIYNGFKRLKP